MNDEDIISEIKKGIRKGKTQDVIKLVDDNPHLLNAMTQFGTWLHIAAKRGEMDIIKYLVNKGIDINANGGIIGGNALNLAASSGKLDVVKYLLDNGIKMDSGDPEKNPLFAAIYGNYLEVAKELVKRGIDISIRYSGDNMKNMNAYDFAMQWGRKEIADFLKSV